MQTNYKYFIDYLKSSKQNLYVTVLASQHFADLV